MAFINPLKYDDFLAWAERFSWLYIYHMAMGGNIHHFYLTPAGSVVIVIVDIAGKVLGIGSPAEKV